MKTKNKKIEEILEKDEENEKLSNYLKKKEKSNHAGITLVSLVVTIIVLILLAGISINLILGNEGIFTIAQRAKENMELAQIEEQEKLNALYTDLDFNTEGEGVTVGNSYDAITEFYNFKKAIAKAIQDAGGTPPENPILADENTFRERIVGEKGIVAEVTKDATAKAENITKDKTAWVNGKKITGTMQNSTNTLTLVGTITATKATNYIAETVTLDCKSLPNYTALTENHFFIVPTKVFFTFTSGNGGGTIPVTNDQFLTNYNSTTGILSVQLPICNRDMSSTGRKGGSKVVEANVYLQ